MTFQAGTDTGSKLWCDRGSGKFRNRGEAGWLLASRLEAYDPKSTLVLALPRGGVPVAAEIAARNGYPLDLLLVRKVGAPGHEELAVGAVVDGEDPHVIVNEAIAREVGLSAEKVRMLANRELIEIERQRHVYLSGRKPLSMRAKTVILVDDGIATGASLKAAVFAARKKGAARVIVAVPVAPSDSLAAFEDMADKVICLETPEPFHAVGVHYETFPQVGDHEVIELLTANARAQTGGGTA